MPKILAFQPQYFKSFACAGPDCETPCGFQSQSQAQSRESSPNHPVQLCNVDGELEAFVSMSCEAAVKRALFSPDIMKLEEQTVDYNNYIDYVLEPENYVKDGDGELFWNLRIACVYVLQNRRYPVWLRAALLGLFTGQAGEFLETGRAGEIAGLCEECMTNMDDGAYDDYAGQIPDRRDIKLSVMLRLLEVIDENVPGGDGLFNTCLNQMKEGLGITGSGQPVREIIDKFTETRKLYYAPFFNSRDYIYENYLVNDMFSAGFPFTYEREGGIYPNFVRLAVKYILLKFMLLGMSGHYKRAFGRDAAVKAVAALTGAFEQNPGLTDKLAEKLEYLEMDSIGRLCILLKD